MRTYESIKHSLTREWFDKYGLTISFNEEGQPLVYRNGRELKQHYITAKHKYGKDLTYITISLMLDGNKQRNVVLSNIVWVYFNGQIPEGYDVDHINNNPLDNSLENLQLLTRQENIRKRGCGANQWTANCSEEERQRKHQENKKIKEDRDRRRVERKERQSMAASIRRQLEQIALERTYYNLLLKEAHDSETRKWITKRVKALKKQRIGLNKWLEKLAKKRAV